MSANPRRLDESLALLDSDPPRPRHDHGDIHQEPDIDTMPDDGMPEPDYSDMPEAKGFERQLTQSTNGKASEHARTNGKAHEPKSEAGETAMAVTLDDLYAYLPEHKYIFVPTRELWPAASVNARIPPIIDEASGDETTPSAWLDKHRAVEQMTWAPGMPMVIENRLVANGGWIDRPGCNTFNLYRPPMIEHGSTDEAGPWLAHVHHVFPEEAGHIIRWLAHRVQHPGEKINHALVLGGAQGIGKDSIIEPVTDAVGPWNVHEVSPVQLMGRFNGYVKSVILRVSEARDQGDAGGGKIDRYAVYEHSKTLLAAPPTVLRVDEKNIREYSVMNVVGVVFTTNHSDGLYLPADDRRHFVAWSELRKEDFTENYWKDLHHWYEQEGGCGHVTAYLAQLDLSGFDAKAPPPKTAGFHRMVDAGRAPEDAEMADTLEMLKNPTAVTITMICTYASESFRDWLTDRRNSRQIPHRLEAAGYVAVRNDGQTDGRWKVEGKNQVIYAKRILSVRDRIIAATNLCRGSRP
jgi:hypothetical protein